MSKDGDQNNIENFLNKIQNGDTSLLVVTGILLIIPVIAIFFLTNNPKAGKRVSQEKMRAMVQRKNVFNFGTKDGKGKSIGPRSESSGAHRDSSGGWFSSSRTPEQIVNDQLDRAMKKLERDNKVIAPSYLDGDDKLFYEAEKNYYLCMAQGRLEEGKYAEVEDFIKQALDYNGDNPFVVANAFSLLAKLYELWGKPKESEEAAKKFLEAVGNLPEGYRRPELKNDVRNAYKSLESLSEYSDPSMVLKAQNNFGFKDTKVFPTRGVLKKLQEDFPIRME